MADEHNGGTAEPTEPMGGPDPSEDPEDGRTSEDARFTQSDLDRYAQRAIRSREEKLRREYEEKTLRESNEFRELYEREKNARESLELERETAKVLGDLGLSEFSPFFGADTGTIEGRTTAAKTLKKAFDREVERRVAERLKTSKPHAGGPTPEPKLPHQMSPEEFVQYKREKGIA